LDSATGRRVAETQGQRALWRQPPWPLDAQRIAVTPAGRQVALFDFITGKPLWQHEADRKFTASGEPPQVIGNTDCLLCCIARNYGHELDRLDLRTGARLWPQPLLLRDRPDLRRAALDETALYVEAGGALEAIALANGLRRWRQPLTGGSNWQVHLTKNSVLAHPVAAEVKVSATFLARRYVPLDGAALFPTLAPWSVARVVPECMWAFSQALAPSRLPVVQCDPKTGQVLHRLHFDGRGPTASVAVFDKQAVVAIGDRAWGLR
ncbi:MAG: PQQ-binding-like beta-propeller repeat protein, partial [Planctomycetia bacterium]|nr:PQQ-binding-like beta-propeller repeat protein [Planctomycetia bacterium]